MKVIFTIGYRTSGNEKLYLVGGNAGAGKEEPFGGEMHNIGNDRWTWQTDLSPAVTEIHYRYARIEDVNGNEAANGAAAVFEPWGRRHHVRFDPSQPVYHLYDYWREIPPSSGITFYTSAFTKNLFARKVHDPASAPMFDRTLIVRVPNPRVEKKQQVAIAGNQVCLGFWDPEQAQNLNSTDFPEWEIRFNADEIAFPFEYKFLIRDESTQTCLWETEIGRAHV
jgi:4-alpha-glucanotransferase